MRYLFMIATLLIFTLNMSAQSNVQIPDFDTHFAGINATVVIHDMNADIRLVYNPAHAETRLAPCSTFKIANAAIALETESMPDASEIIEWDSNLYPLDGVPTGVEPFSEWRDDHNLASAMRYSVIWFYTEVAKRIGQEQMQSELERIGYGNMQSSTWIKPRQFWLTGDLQITAEEQVEFLRAFYNGELFSEHTTEIVKDIILLEETDDYRLSGKTGSCLNDAGTTHIWLAGYLEVADNVYIYALNARTSDFFTLSGGERVTLIKQIFADMGVLPA